ncbi:MAG: hypothetical protein AAF456_13760 [Planctomycetota bacterium]
MDTESNPCAAPAYGERATETPQSASTASIDFLPIMRRWERLRLYYNGALIVLVLFLSFVVFPRNASDIGYWFSVCFGGLIANLCYLTAPTIEAYGIHFRLWNGTLTTVLFLAGLGFTALLALWCIATYPAT